MRKHQSALISFALIGVATAISLICYSALPDPMTTHWDAAGKPNGSMSRAVGASFAPVLMIVLYIILRLSPRIDPRRATLEALLPFYDAFIPTMMGFLLYVHMITLGWNLGWRINIGAALAPGIAAIFYVIGVLTERSTPNWFVGVRTRWTLSNDEVWRKTNNLAGRLFKWSALPMLLAVFFPQLTVVFVLVPALGIGLGTVIYSYVLFRRIERAQHNN